MPVACLFDAECGPLDDKLGLVELQRLLALYPGVRDQFVFPYPGGIRLAVRLNDPESVARLVRCSHGANVRVDVWMGGPGRLESPRADPAHLSYAFEFPHRAPDDERQSPLSVFGIFVAWDLHAYGALSRDEANLLLAVWDGARV
jgi:hypothetical protein